MTPEEGCGCPSGVATAASSAAPTNAPSETPTATGPEAPAAYLTTAGYGEIKVGQPVPKSTTLVAWTAPTDECFGHGY